MIYTFLNPTIFQTDIILLYLSSSKWAAQSCDKPHDQPSNHNILPVITVSKITENWCQEHKATNKNCKYVKICPTLFIFQALTQQNWYTIRPCNTRSSYNFKHCKQNNQRFQSRKMQLAWKKTEIDLTWNCKQIQHEIR